MDQSDWAAQYEPEAISGVDRSINLLLNSDADIARLRIIDFDIAGSPIADRRIEKQLVNLSGYEIRTPIARLGSTSFSRLLRDQVIAYFADDGALGAIKTDRQRVQREHPNQRFVEEAVALVESGECAGPYPAANKIVRNRGFLPKDKWRKDCGKIQASSEAVAIDRIGRNASKLLKGGRK